MAFIKHTDTATHTCRGQKVKSKQGTNRRNENEPKHNERDHKRRCINNKKKREKLVLTFLFTCAQYFKPCSFYKFAVLPYFLLLLVACFPRCPLLSISASAVQAKNTGIIIQSLLFLKGNRSKTSSTR